MARFGVDRLGASAQRKDQRRNHQRGGDDEGHQVVATPYGRNEDVVAVQVGNE